MSTVDERGGVPAVSTWRVDPLRLNGYGHEVYLLGHGDGYDAGVAVERRRGGYDRGFDAGWRARVEQERRAWQAMAATVKCAGGPFSLTHAELTRRRAELPAGYVPRPVPSFEACMRSWDGRSLEVAS